MVPVGRFIRSHRQVSCIQHEIGTKPCQYCPYLSINRERTPPVKIDDSFRYLGKDFSFGMDCTKIKGNIIDDIWMYVNN